MKKQNYIAIIEIKGAWVDVLDLLDAKMDEAGFKKNIKLPRWQYNITSDDNPYEIITKIKSICNDFKMGYIISLTKIQDESLLEFSDRLLQ